MTNLNEIYEDVAKELGLPKHVVKEAYSLWGDFMRETMEGMPFSDRDYIPFEEFNDMRRSFNLPGLGKLVATRELYKKRSRQAYYLRKLKEREND